MPCQLERDRELYQALGLAEGAPIDEVRRAYRVLAVKLHPDKNLGDAEAAEAFKRINTAHQILTDPVKKAVYDKGPPEPRGPSEGTRQFAQGVYRESSLADLEKRRREREQEMLRRRMQRDPARQGQEKRASYMGEAQREFWRAKDREREQELTQRVRREKAARDRELEEKAKAAENARRRVQAADDAAQRAAMRARDARERDREREANFSAEVERRARLEVERQRQEDARRREIDRQIARHHRQAEVAKEARLKEQQRKFSLHQESERAGVEQEEGCMRKDGVELHEAQERSGVRRQLLRALRDTQDCYQRDALCEDEHYRRLIVTRQQSNERGLVCLASDESRQRTHHRTEVRTRFSDISFTFHAARQYWESALQERCQLLSGFSSRAASVASEERVGRQFVSLVGEELNSRWRVASSRMAELIGKAELFHAAVGTVSARDLHRNRESDRRHRVAADEVQHRCTVASISSRELLQVVETERRGGCRSAEEAARKAFRSDHFAGRNLIIDRAERRARDVVLARTRAQLSTAAAAAEQQQAEADALRRQLSALAQEAEKSKQEAGRRDARNQELELENVELRREVAELRAALAEARRRPFPVTQEVIADAPETAPYASAAGEKGRTTPRRRGAAPGSPHPAPQSARHSASNSVAYRRVPATSSASGRTPRKSGRSPSPAPYDLPRAASTGNMYGRRSPRVQVRRGTATPRDKPEPRDRDEGLSRSTPRLTQLVPSRSHSDVEAQHSQSSLESPLSPHDRAEPQKAAPFPTTLPLQADAPAWVRRINALHTPRGSAVPQ